MKRILSSLLFAGVLLALGMAAYLAFPGGSLQVAEPDPVRDAGRAPAAINSGPLYNTLTQVLDNGVASASQLKTSIESSSTVTVLQVLKYDPTFGFIVYDPTDPFSSDFAITTGLPVFTLVEGSGSPVYTQVGDVPGQGSVSFNLSGSAGSCTYNFISLPLDQGSLAVASDLATAIGDVAQVLKYDPTFGYIVYDPTDPFSSNFALQIGYPYFVCMNASKVWP